jgi:hypothetical protein
MSPVIILSAAQGFTVDFYCFGIATAKLLVKQRRACDYTRITLACYHYFIDFGV